MTKTIGFRPTDDNETAIQQFMKKENVGQTEAVNKLIEMGKLKDPSTFIPPQIVIQDSETSLPAWLEKNLEGFFRGKKSKAIQYFFSNALTAHKRGTY